MVSIPPQQPLVTASPPATPANIVIIHHISDLHFSRKTGSLGNQALIHYSNYLKQLPPERTPQIVVFTGDLTESGEGEDFNTVAYSLQTSFSQWHTVLKEHIFIVPGQNDVDWIDDKPSFRLFQEKFIDFGLPTLGRQNSTALYTDTANTYLAYLLNTCASIEELLKPLPKQLQGAFTDLPKQHREFLKHFYKSVNTKRDGKRGVPDPKLRSEFLALVEQTLISLDTGLLLKTDFNRLTTAMAPFMSTLPVSATAAVMEPLKILVTHHPLIVPLDSLLSHDPKAIAYKAAVAQLRTFGFHLALHGHMHTAQVLTDFAIIEGNDSLAPLRQFGAGSLGNDTIFNEIVATRTADEPRWQLNVETVNVTPRHGRSVFSLAVLDPAESQSRVDRAKYAAELDEKHTAFNEQLRLVFRLFSEAVQRESSDLVPHKGGDIPAKPLELIKYIVEHVIFKECKVQIGLAVKEITSDHQGKLIYNLNNRYIDQLGAKGALHQFSYLLNAASWSLVLGRTLVFPDDFVNDSKLTNEDYAWLQQQGRMQQINAILGLQRKRLADEIAKDGGVDYQIKDLNERKARLDTIADAYQRSDLALIDTYQRPTDETARYPFISLPIPLRPNDSAPSGLVEVGVLNIDIIGFKDESKRKEIEEKQRRGETIVARDLYFTQSRIDMLSMLSAVIYLIMTEAAQLKSPPSTWIEPKATYS